MTIVPIYKGINYLEYHLKQLCKIVYVGYSKFLSFKLIISSNKETNTYTSFVHNQIDIHEFVIYHSRLLIPIYKV